MAAFSHYKIQLSLSLSLSLLPYRIVSCHLFQRITGRKIRRFIQLNFDQNVCHRSCVSFLCLSSLSPPFSFCLMPSSLPPLLANPSLQAVVALFVFIVYYYWYRPSCKARGSLITSWPHKV